MVPTTLIQYFVYYPKLIFSQLKTTLSQRQYKASILFLASRNPARFVTNKPRTCF